MWPLLALALMMFFTAVRLWRSLAARQYRRLPEETWKAWVRKPEKGEGEVGEIIRYVLEDAGSTREINTRFAEVTGLTLPPIDRQMQLLGTLVAAAPLVGLLGTVFGMLVTFQALAAGGGGGKVTEAMAVGISQALFPPEVGLCIALPGLVFIQLIRRQRRELEAFLAHLESYIVQWYRTRAVSPQTAAQPPTPATVVVEADAVLTPSPVAA